MAGVLHELQGTCTLLEADVTGTGLCQPIDDALQVNGEKGMIQ
jgi:hypothetical protein